MGGVLIAHAEGSLRALVTSMPRDSGSPSSWHRQIGLLSTRPASSGQHSWSGFVRLLPGVTKLRQSDMLKRIFKQSRPGAGAGPKQDSGLGMNIGVGSNPGTDIGVGTNPEIVVGVGASPGTDITVGANPGTDIKVGLGAFPSTDPNTAAEKMKAARGNKDCAIAVFNK